MNIGIPIRWHGVAIQETIGSVLEEYQHRRVVQHLLVAQRVRVQRVHRQVHPVQQQQVRQQVQQLQDNYMDGTHFSSLQSKKRVLYDAPPTGPVVGDFFWDNLNNRMAVWVGTQWNYVKFDTSSTTTSTSSSTSTTSTSSSSSTSTTTSSSTSTSTSTTTTL